MNFSDVKISYSDAREIAIYFWSLRRLHELSRKAKFVEFIDFFQNIEDSEKEKFRNIFFENLIVARRYVVPSLLDECGGHPFDIKFPIEELGMHDLLSVSCALNGQKEKVYFLDIEEDVEELLKFFDVLPDNVKQIVIDFKNGEQVPASYDEEDYYKEFPRKFAKINFNLKKSPKTLAQLQKRGLISEKTIPCAYKEKYPEVWKEIHAPFERDLEKIIKKQGLR